MDEPAEPPRTELAVPSFARGAREPPCGVRDRRALTTVAAVYLDYTYYINILEDAYGCWSLTVHSCVNTYTLL